MKCKADFFGLPSLPMLDINETTLKALAKESVNQGLTVAGVQKKISLHLEKSKDSRLTLVGYPSGYILKPQSAEYKELPEAEDLTMDMAAISGIKVVPHGLIETVNGELAYISKRIDRIKGKKLAMEDFCQLSERLTEDKYHSSYEQCIKIIKKYSYRYGLDISEFFLRITFCFVTGNSDMHLKNFSMIETSPGSNNYILSAAYDLLPVNIVNSLDDEETALTMVGKRKNFDGSHFMTFADDVGIQKKVAENMITKIVSCEKRYYDLIEESYLSNEFKEEYMKLVKERIELVKRAY